MLVGRGALLAVGFEAGVGLRTNADAGAGLYVGYRFANADGDADNFVTDANGVVCWGPTWFGEVRALGE